MEEHQAKRDGDSASLRDILSRLFELEILPKRPPVVCPQTFFAEGYDPAAEVCGMCKSEFKKKCMALFEAKNAVRGEPRRGNLGKSARELLDEYIKYRGFSSENQIGMLFEQALPVVEWLLDTLKKG